MEEEQKDEQNQEQNLAIEIQNMARKEVALENTDDAELKEKRNNMPKPPKKMILIISILLLAGSILLMIGLIDEFTSDSPEQSRNFSFVLIGGLLLIPGIFYGFKMIHAYYFQDDEEMQGIINDFPMDAY